MLSDVNIKEIAGGDRIRFAVGEPAERLTLHKNTIQYRIRQAEQSLRHQVAQDRLRVELALLAAHWLGPAVLRPADARS